MAVSLRDVAARAGVSVKTVSNVVNDYPHVTPATRQRVVEAIESLGYRPNLSARNLRRGRTGLIALALPELDSPYFAELARFVIKAAEEQQWTVLIDQTDGVRERELVAIKGLGSNLVDGLLLSPLALDGSDLAEIGIDVPLVLLGERVSHGPASHVAIDNVAAAREAVGHLVGLGRRRIAAIGAQRVEAGQTARLRLAGYHEALESAGLPYAGELVATVERYSRADGAAAMTRLLDGDGPPDAVFCFNDLMALGALRALHERGLRVPDDVAVIGFDDIEDGAFHVPTLSTVSPDKEQIAGEAVRALAAKLRGEDDEPRELTADHRLVVRESTAGAGTHARTS
ncbi:MAG: LacI family DNA-binding transcriptional regulator [Streptosporangiales bacterium]|nr:LacI family DNA-binding transcriptional regulator [Streptosporangiales bacterium]